MMRASIPYLTANILHVVLCFNQAQFHYSGKFH